jgi:hypothetical protein
VYETKKYDKLKHRKKLGLNKMRKSLQVEKWSNSTEEKDE